MTNGLFHDPALSCDINKPSMCISAWLDLNFLVLGIICSALAVLVFCMGKVFLPGGPAFATLVIWICSVVAAQTAHLVGVKQWPAPALPELCLTAKAAKAASFTSAQSHRDACTGVQSH